MSLYLKLNYLNGRYIPQKRFICVTSGKFAKLRPPIITIVGHINHGKTTLLDSLRNSEIALNEAGGITQKIGSFTVTTKNNKKICFIDTPGHFAFNHIRSRGIAATDLVLLIVAGDEGVKDQTLECIRLIRQKKVPFLLLITKIDKHVSESNVGNIIETVNKYGLDVSIDDNMLMVSARNKQNLDALLEKIIETCEETSVESENTEGYILEQSKLKDTGEFTNLLLVGGELKNGDVICTDTAYCHINKIVDENNNVLKKATSCQPCRITTGWHFTPYSGQKFRKVDKKELKQLIKKMKATEYSPEVYNKSKAGRTLDIDSLNADKNDDDKKKDDEDDVFYSETNPMAYNVILKADNQGSLEALLQIVVSCPDKRVQFNIVDFGLGNVTSEDIMLANTTKSRIFTFNLSDHQTKLTEKLEGKFYNSSVIYDVLDEMKKDVEEEIGYSVNYQLLGKANIQKVFKFTGKMTHTAAGCMITEGYVKKDEEGLRVLLYRVNGDKLDLVSRVNIESLYHFKKEAVQVNQGMECGIVLEKFTAFQPKDILVFKKKVLEKIHLNWAY